MKAEVNTYRGGVIGDNDKYIVTFELSPYSRTPGEVFISQMRWHGSAEGLYPGVIAAICDLARELGYTKINSPYAGSDEWGFAKRPDDASMFVKALE